MNKVRENDRAAVLKQNQQVESYLLELNKKGQYGVILYSNSDLVIPDPDGTTLLIKYLDIYNIPDELNVPSISENFLNSLPERQEQKRSISYLYDDPGCCSFHEGISIFYSCNLSLCMHNQQLSYWWSASATECNICHNRIQFIGYVNGYS